MSTVIIVEDERSIRQMYELKFLAEKFKVHTAADGREALKKIKLFKPEIILLDLRMPGMSGDEMLAKLRAEEWGADIRVVVLTNVSKDEAPASLRFLGVSRYVVKAHHTPAQIVDIVREILGLKR